MSRLSVDVTVNGEQHSVEVDTRRSLLDLLREDLALTGTQKGCDQGACGACTVHLDGQRRLSCLTMAVQADGREVTTIEGIGTPDDLHPVQQAFLDCDAFQCGACTAGQVMSAAALLDEEGWSTADDVRELMSGNLCRCGAYPRIVDAVLSARTAREA
ncbi:xanthine dehydrogenase YagT iron-sulfur-binding subunit [Nocardioides alpinus]|uniref:(2Fe-2S)-binding protein n=1 Tax=Nocardioides alpinus TaxID=748909 RepID=A0A1I1API2_9ACTN|nr:(2Fe-2S)-binding protein [Nocardioides alpinus]PKH39540.1 (2Fe-2S)-binding protein [Nocardioides alpinus]SFB39965.1 xanthine dehydrogenase YagT iron-sulfur-binding subunit [Nocardioides alpinus]